MQPSANSGRIHSVVTPTERIALSALLHDIGKFWSRTRVDPPFTPDERDYFGTYAHALWSAHFVEQYIRDPEITAWVRMHHKPDTREARLISLADWLSSGERMEQADIPRGKPEAASLANIFDGVRIGAAGPGDTRTFFPLVEHGDFRAPFMPGPGVTASESNYRALWDKFVCTVKLFQDNALDLSTWLALLRRFCSRIPAATPTKIRGFLPDINLYDHSRGVAALAACFAADGMTESKASAIQDAMVSGDGSLTSEPICQLVCGTLGGIQEFLYTIVSKQAAKTLRGRSFVLQLAAEVCAEQVCEQAGVPACCIVYCGGGRFFALLPLAADVPSIQSQLSRRVLDHFKGQVALHLGAIPLAPNDFKGDAFAAQWSKAGLEANRLRTQRLTQLAASDYDAAFGFLDDGGVDNKCGVCGRNDALTLLDETPICEDCHYYAEIGKELRTARWLVRTDTSHSPEGFNAFCALFGYELHLIASPDSRLPRIQHVVELNGFDPARTKVDLRPPADASFGYRLLAQAWPQSDDGSVKTFEELANSATGASKLGVFRADVDNLGALFATGLGKRATISRVASLSAALADFFEGYLNYLVSTRYADSVGFIYSGGDDLFVVGAWNSVLDFTIELRNRFDEFTGRHPAVSLSGGVAVIDHALPLRFAAELAHDAEEASKSYVRGDRAKNALTVFRTTVGFEELDRFVEFRNLIHRMLTDAGDPMPAGFLRRLYDVWDTYLCERKIIEKNRRGATLEAIRAEARWQRWRWALAYNLHRFSRRHERWKLEIDEVRSRILDINNPIDDRLGLPLRWVELLTRKEEE